MAVVIKNPIKGGTVFQHFIAEGTVSTGAKKLIRGEVNGTRARTYSTDGGKWTLLFCDVKTDFDLVLSVWEDPADKYTVEDLTVAKVDT